MFSRENRRQKLPSSGSRYELTKEWELYRNMLFLIPHITEGKYLVFVSFISTYPRNRYIRVLYLTICN